MTLVKKHTPNVTQQLSERAVAAKRKLATQSLFLTAEPDYMRPRLGDQDITQLSDEDLSELLVQYTEWKNYAAGLLALAEVEESELRELVETAEAVAMVKDWGGTSKDRVSIAKAGRQSDPEVVYRKEKLGSAYAYRKLTQVIVESLDNDAFAVSREITRRNGGDARARRSERFSR